MIEWLLYKYYDFIYWIKGKKGGWTDSGFNNRLVINIDGSNIEESLANSPLKIDLSRIPNQFFETGDKIDIEDLTN